MTLTFELLRKVLGGYNDSGYQIRDIFLILYFKISFLIIARFDPISCYGSNGFLTQTGDAYSPRAPGVNLECLFISGCALIK